MQSDIDVQLEDGVYTLTQPLTFGPQDGGSHHFTVILGTPGEQSITVRDPNISSTGAQGVVSAAVSPNVVLGIPEQAVA